MKSLDRARKKARELRKTIGVEPENLRANLLNYFQGKDINVEAVPADEIDGHEARLRADGNLFYDERLDKKPARKLFVLAHELGHLDLEHKFTNYTDGHTLGAGTDYANNGAGAVARYHARVYEEAEADAFATEFLAPCREIFQKWLESDSVTSAQIAADCGAEIEVVRTQLAQGLYEYLYGERRQSERKTLKVVLKPDVDYSKQLAAAQHIGTPALIDAGPGTGKTTTLVMRVDYLLNEKDEDPGKMLILTFSNEAAATLRSRIVGKVGEEKAGQIEINTFHGFGYAFLLKRGGNLVHPDTTIIDEAAQIEFIERLLGSADCEAVVNLRDLEETAVKIARHINHLKQRAITPEMLRRELKVWEPTEPNERKAQSVARDILKVYESYEKQLVKERVVDFADLINKPIELLELGVTEAGGVSELARAVRNNYRWIMVDEYQDVTRSVSRLLQLIAGEENPPWVVGDARQSIYEFLGAHRENIHQFERDFPGATIYGLANNFRSSTDIVQAANQLAALMEEPETPKDTKEPEKWTAATLTDSYWETPVLVAEAETQEAEYCGIVSQVREWIMDGVPPEFIAVLARTNADVANLAVALARENITATVTGILDTDGVAGDLVAAFAFVDAPTATLPRIVFALGRDSFDRETLNEIVKILLREFETRGDFSGAIFTVSDEWARDFIKRITAFYDQSLRQKHSADGFSILCSFLFEGTNYLRQVLAGTEETAKNLALSEVVTVLTRAMSYRFTHPHLQPLYSRVGLSERLRSEISGAVSGQTTVPPPAADTVRVMTCHKAKGLEFPFVIVSGQSLNSKESDLSLPPKLKPKLENERAAADSLLFVGVTRAQQAVVVSYSTSKNAKTNTLTREATDLLKNWKEVFNVPAVSWRRAENLEKGDNTPRACGALWGGEFKQRSGSLPVAALSRQDCALRVYLEDWVGIRFPTSLWHLYPQFYESVRYTLEQTVFRSHMNAPPMTPAEAEDWFVKTFVLEKTLENPLAPLYLKNGSRIVRRFAEIYKPQNRAKRFIKSAVLDLESLSGYDVLSIPVRLSLVAHYEEETGTQHAIIFRPESLTDAKTERVTAEIPWSRIDRLGRKLAFLLLRKAGHNIEPWVYSGADGILYKLLWNRNSDTTKADTESALVRLKNYDNKQFEWQINERMCGRCPCRIGCPYWLKALPKNE